MAFLTLPPGVSLEDIELEAEPSAEADCEEMTLEEMVDDCRRFLASLPDDLVDIDLPPEYP